MGKCILVFLLLWGISPSSTLIAQRELSHEELSDYTSRAKNQIRVFLNNIPKIASGSHSDDIRDAAVNSTLKIFSARAFIEEQSKNSGTKKKWSPKEYLNELSKRSDKAPILIDFEILDDLSPGKMKKKINADGSISYSGSMKFRQYYCKLKDPDAIVEPTPDKSNINCKYSDRTDKRVKFEITLLDESLGKFWVTKVASIEVERVLDWE